MKANAFAQLIIKIKNCFGDSHSKVKKTKKNWPHADNSNNSSYSNYSEQEKHKQKLEEIKAQQLQYRFLLPPF